VPFGYHGRYLRIDVSPQRPLPPAAPVSVEARAVPLAEAVLRQYLGGRGRCGDTSMRR
jgi:hypothetical protein